MRRGALACLLTLAVLFPAGTAQAAWNAIGGGSASAKAKQMPVGNQPTASVSGREVSVSWAQSSFSGGGAMSGYEVRRYGADGQLQSIGSGCSGTLSALSCTEQAVPPGTWTYAVSPRQGNNWTGAESPQSVAVTVQAPALSFSSSTEVTSLPTTLSGSVSSFVPGQTVSFRLDHPSSGTILSGSVSPTPIPSSGSASVTVTIPAGTANGSHTVYAVGSQGDVASAAISVNTPQVTSSVIAKSAGGDPGYVTQGGTYYVYANVSGSGNPPAGLGSLTADVSAITLLQTAASLSAGSYTVGGQSFNYRSAQLTATTLLSEGSKPYTLTLTDAAGTETQSSFSVTMDNTPPSASDIQTANTAGGTAGTIEEGDSIAFTYSEPIEAGSIFAGWDGSSTSVVVRNIDGGIGSDTIEIWNATNTSQLPLGTVSLGRNDYHGLGTTTFGATGTVSTMVRSGSTVTVTLGTAAGGGIQTAANTGTMTWTPSATATDRAGNPASTTARAETGAADKDF